MTFRISYTIAILSLTACLAYSYYGNGMISKVASKFGLRATNKEKKYCLNVTICVKPERRKEFLKAIEENAKGTLTNEPLNRLYTWGENINVPNQFHFQEQFIGEEGFKSHTKMHHFAVWDKFASDPNSPFTQPVKVDFFQEL
eukprot:gene13860-18587_t